MSVLSIMFRSETPKNPIGTGQNWKKRTEKTELAETDRTDKNVQKEAKSSFKTVLRLTTKRTKGDRIDEK